MPRPGILLKRAKAASSVSVLRVSLRKSLIFIHRWMGVALSILFTLWFCSGIVMMYWSFPAVGRMDRLEHAPVLDPARIRLLPEEAYARLHRDDPPGQVRLTTFDGRPVYRFSGEAGGARRRRSGRPGQGAGQAVVYADDGAIQNEVNDAMIDRVAAAWVKQSLSSARKEVVEQVDQWTVAAQLRNLRPLYKYSFADGRQVYVSGRDAEVVQSTTRQSRFWAWLGPIPHWMYFAPLRKNQPQWFQFVVWSSGIGALAALLGIIVALWMLSPSRKYRHAGAPTAIPYRGWKRWHTIIGLAFGVITLTWAFSGMLSMGPFDFVERLAGNRPTAGTGKARRRTRPAAKVDIPAALRSAERLDLATYAGKSAKAAASGVSVLRVSPKSAKAANRGDKQSGNSSAAAASGVSVLRLSQKTPADAVAALGNGFQVKELEFTMFAGEPVYLAADGTGATRIVPVSGEPRSEFDREKLMGLLKEAAGANLAELRIMDEYDSYYLDRTRSRPLPVVYLRLNDEDQTRYYIDVKTGQVAGSYSTRNRVNRWLYHGLHSLDFPWLYKHRPLWDIVVIVLMLGGTAVCVTSLVLAWRVVSRKLAPLLLLGAAFRPAVSEDLSQVTNR